MARMFRDVRNWIRPSRSWGRAETAVSPVISTILMVAITVVLSATAFLLVADVGHKTATPSILLSFRVWEADDKLTVSTIQEGSWDRIFVFLQEDAGSGDVFLGSAAPDYHNQPATRGGAVINSEVAVSSVGSPIVGSDSLWFCRDTGPPEGPVRLRIVYKEGSQLIGHYDFQSLRVC